MDTSETYIKMCEKAKKIQALRPVETKVHYRRAFQKGDYYLLLDDTLIKRRCCDPIQVAATDTYDDPLSVWLPRQDQLQEMVKDARGIFNDYGYGNNEYNEFMGLSVSDYWDSFTSMERLWFAFVMKEKYNKVWDGRNWISG